LWKRYFTLQLLASTLCFIGGVTYGQTFNDLFCPIVLKVADCCKEFKLWVGLGNNKSKSSIIYSWLYLKQAPWAYLQSEEAAPRML